MKKTGCKLTAILLLALLLIWAFPTLAFGAAPDPEDGETTSEATGEAAGEATSEAPLVPMAQVLLTNYDLKKTGTADNPTYELYVTLTNKGDADAYNILLSFEDENRAFLPAYGTSNQLQIPYIAAHASVESGFQLVSQEEVEAFALFFTLQYRNPSANVTSSFYIGSFTGHLANAVQLLQVDIDGNMDEAGKIPVRAVVANRTTEALHNLRLNVYSSMDGTSQSVELGTLEAGETLDTVHPLSLLESRVQQVRVSLSYQDADGISYTTTEEVHTLYGYRQTDTEGPDTVTSIFEELRPYMTQILVHLALMAIVVVMLLVILLRRKRKAPHNVRRHTGK